MISIVIPFRSDNEVRVANLKATLTFLLNFPIFKDRKPEIIIVEHDQISKLSIEFKIKYEYRFIESKSKFNRGRCLNTGIRIAQNSKIACWDSDCFFLYPDLVEILSTSYESVLMVKKNCTYIGQVYSDVLRARMLNNLQLNSKYLSGNVWEVTKSGGVCFVRNGVIWPEIPGWGFEDNLFDYRYLKQAELCLQPMFHLWHPVIIGSKQIPWDFNKF